MQKTLLIFVFILATATMFAQTQSADTAKTSNVKEEIAFPSYGVYDDLADMKQRFEAYKEIQKKEKAIAEKPQDEHLWEAAKGPQDFATPQMVNAYSVKKPKGYASNVRQEKVDKETIGNTIKSSLILSKSSTTKKDDNWQLKLKNK